MSDNKGIYTVSMISPELFDAFAHQARKIFHDHELGTLLESIRDKGIKTPLTARRSPVNARRYELVAGERRLRAARELGLAEVPVFIRDLTDAEAEEESLIENMARVNLTPVEEANAFKRMLELESSDGTKLYTISSLAKKLARGEADIRAGLKILNSPMSLLKEIDTTKDERRVSVEVVAMVGRIPDPKARERAAADIMAGVSLKGGPASGKPLNVTESRKLVRERYMLKIDLSAKEADDMTLVPLKLTMIDGVEQRVQGGSCKDCPFRSGCMSDIADLLQEGSAGAKGGRNAGIDPNICTQPGCLQAKRDELWRRRCEQHLKDGGRVMTDAAAKKEFSYEDRLIYNSAYAKLSDEPEYRIFGRYDAGKWSELIKGLSATVTLARVPSNGKEVKLINIKEAAELVRARFKEQSSADDSKEAAAAKAARAKELRAEKIEKESIKIGLGCIEERITKVGLSIDEWPELFEIVLGNAGSDGMTVLGQWLEIKLPKGGHHSGRDYENEITKAVKAKITSANGWLAWCVLASIARGIKYGGANASDYKAITEALDIDVKAIKSEAAIAVDAKLKPAAPKHAKSKGPLKPGEKGDTTGMFDRGQSGAKQSDIVKHAPATDSETVYEADDEPGAPAIKAAKKVVGKMMAEPAADDWLAQWRELPAKPAAKDKAKLKSWNAQRMRIKRWAAKAKVTLPAK